MTATAEKVFPRGGRNPALSSKPAKRPGFSLFNKTNSKVKKKLKKKKVRDVKKDKKRVLKDEPSKPKLNGLIVKSVTELGPATIQDGMLVLGIVSQVSEKIVSVSLPGGLRGIVNIGNVSEFYKQLLKGSSEVASLKSILEIGNVVAARVISVSEGDRRKFYLTLDPKLINSKLNELETGMVLCGTVKSKEEHGYDIDLGVPSVTGFLNFKKVSDSLIIGQLIRCAVIKHEASIVELSLLSNDIKKACLPQDTSCPIHSFIPGMQFQLTVTKVLKNGVEVTYKNDHSQKGYIHEFHLPTLFPKLEKIEIGAQYTGTLLYVQPLVNIPYFKVMSHKPQNWIYPYGDVVKGKVVKSAKGGIMFRIGTKLLPMRCFVPTSLLTEAYKAVEQEVDLDSVYPAGKVVDMIRLGNIDYMMRCYCGDTRKENVMEKYFAITDVKCGDIIKCTISEIGDKTAKVRFGNLTGIVPLNHLTDIPLANPGSKFKVGQKVKARVTYVDMLSRVALMTMKPTLLDKSTNVLMNYNKVKLRGTYTGCISIVRANSMVVQFFNKITGVVRKEWTPYPKEDLHRHYCAGHLVKCTVLGTTQTELKLSLLSSDDIFNFNVGKKYEVEVDEVMKDSIAVNYKTNDRAIPGTIPKFFICEYPGMGKALLPTYKPQQKLTVYHVMRPGMDLPLFSTSDFFSRIYDSMGGERAVLKIGKVYPFVFKRVLPKTGRVELLSIMPLRKYKFAVSGLTKQDVMSTKFEKYQIMFGKILSVTGVNVEVSLDVSDVWDKDISISLNLLDVYIDAMKKVINHQRDNKEKYLKNIKLGSRVTSVVENKKGQVVFEVDNASPKGMKEDAGETITGTVVWINGQTRKIVINTEASEVAEDQDEEFELVDSIYRAKILYVGEEVVVVVLKGRGNGRLAFLPRKRHINDFVNPDCPYTVGCMTKVYVEKGKLNNLVGIDRQIKLSEEKRIWKAQEKSLREALKRKMIEDNSARKRKKLDELEIVHENLSGTTQVKKEEDSDGEIQCEYVGVGVNGHVLPGKIKQEVEDSDECLDVSMTSTLLDTMDVDIKSENESGDEADKDIYTKERILLSSSSESDSDGEEGEKVENATDKLNIGFNWDVLKNRELLSAKPRDEEESSSDDEEEGKNTKKKRVRLTKSEREEKARAEEERLRQIEDRLMRADVEPETADDFDRALLAKPNSSALWVKYMAFHLQATEIEKARAVARRALKTISFGEEQEKLNVWVALLNLENLYGNEESLNKTLSEALMCNEPYHIHLHMLNMHGQSNKFQDMERVGNMLMKKFKNVESMWHDVGLGYYKVGKVESARQVLQRALPLLEKKKHVELISKFAQMENKYGSSERAQTLYETILTSFPKRVDVWSCYVDMLVKSNLTDLARQVLERATSQSLPPKKMKTLFKKFLAFEEKHGTPENVEKVRQAAVDYVDKIGSN
ncbi:UNVERIFIED_CONTAM: hypothetical protein PYX00_004749 [Menopon gallinae]|uniref:S1 motif domain-containing protein n=1 Tax=Menopon gallinae TaxID=328185 RepID=A0AAW2I733_9NEOP